MENRILNTTNTNNEKSITIADLWRVFTVALPLMVIVAVLICGIGYAFRKLTYTPAYTSQGTFLVMRDREQTGENINTGGEVQLALMMMETCYEMVTNQNVSVEVAAALELDGGVKYTAKQIRKAVNVSTKSSSLLMKLTATASSPAEAQRILNAYMAYAEEKVDDRFRTDLCNVSDPANLPTVPSSSFGTMRILLFGFLGAVLVYGVYLAIDLLDDRIRTGEDITDVAGLTLLGIVPDAGSTERKYSYKYGKKYGKEYGRYAADTKKKEGK